MIRVAYLFPRGDLGGAEIATIRIIEAHNRTEFAPTAMFMEDGLAADRLRSAQVPVAVAPLLPRLRHTAQRGAARSWIADRLHHHRIDLQHSVMSWTHALAGPVGRSAGVGVVWFQQNRPDPFNPMDWYSALSYADLVLANSHFVAGLQRRMNFRRFPIEVVHLPVVPVAHGQRSDEVREELGARPENVLAVLAGRLQRWKGQDVAIRALALAVQGAPELRLAIVGGTLFDLEPEYRTELETLAASLGVADRVRFTGFRSDMEAVTTSADVVLHTSRRPEPFGLVVAEGLASGRAVIASNAGGVREQVEHDRTGLLVQPDNPQALADALVRLSRDADLRRRLGAAARDSNVMTPSGAAERIEELYRRVLRAKP
jgi:glycosyltransferase involved in cell wall biosynthesis